MFGIGGVCWPDPGSNAVATGTRVPPLGRSTVGSATTGEGCCPPFPGRIAVGRTAVATGGTVVGTTATGVLVFDEPPPPDVVVGVLVDDEPPPGLFVGVAVDVEPPPGLFVGVAVDVEPPDVFVGVAVDVDVLVGVSVV